MKHVYSQPMVEVLCLDKEDVITTSTLNILEAGFDKDMEVDW